jgi:hypothetical protein
MLHLDELNDSWQVFLYSVAIDADGAWAGLAVFDRQIQTTTVELANPNREGERFILTIPPACQRSPQPLVKIRCQLKLSRSTPVLPLPPPSPI